MEELKKLLDIKQFDKIQEEDFQERFKEIANELLNNYCIRKGDKIYEFAEIEFYLYNAKHQDIITYPRSVRLGDWFFHQSGVDICFQTILVNNRDIDELKFVEKDDVFGGILIRSLRKVKKADDKKNADDKKEHFINGPLKCCYELFDQFSALKKDTMETFEYPYIDKKQDCENYQFLKLNDDSIKETSRYLNFKNDENKRNELNKKFNNEDLTVNEFARFKDKKYRFYIDNANNKIAK